MRDEQELSFSDMHERRKHRRFYSALLLVFLAAYVVILITALVVFRSPLFRVKSISVIGNDAISESAILDVVRGAALDGAWRTVKAMLGFGNLLTWPHGTIRDPALLPGAKNITIEKDYSKRSIVVRVEERAPYGIWCLQARESASDSCWWFDESGTIFKRAVDASGGIIIAVHDYSQSGLGSLSRVLPDVFIKNILSVFQVLRSSGLGVKEVALRDLSLQELAVSTYDGQMIYFSLRFPATNALAAINDLSGKPGFNKLQYLDFRAENRVYYK